MRNLEQEREYQARELQINFAAIVCGLVLSVILFFNNAPVLSALLLFGGCGILISKRFGMLSEFAERQEIITFKQQVLHLYCWSKYPTDPDVMRRASEAAKLLYKHGNKHGVKVWVMVYGSPYFYALTYTAKGMQTERAVADIANTFEAFAAQVADFINTTQNQRAKELHGSESEKNMIWASQFVHNQN